MPSTQFAFNVRQALDRCVMLLNRLQPMIGSNAFSCNWPASDAIVTFTSLPITSKATWFITSGITGLTLPGMIDEPACLGGNLMSPKPACGPLDSRRRSLQVLDSL